MTGRSVAPGSAPESPASLVWETVLVAGGLLAGTAWLVLSRSAPYPSPTPRALLRREIDG